MAAIALSAPSLKALKDALRKDFSEEKSSHLSEALASALGFNTHAALLAAAKSQESDPPILDLDTKRFADRLAEFGYPRDDEFDFEWMAGKGEPAISTEQGLREHIEYKSQRDRAWRNLMVCAVNEAISRKLISLRPGDNRWPGAATSEQERRARTGEDGVQFEMALPAGIPAAVYLRDIGWDELAIHVAANPTGKGLMSGNAGFYAGDAFAVGWLERRRGAWLQSSTTMFACRRKLQPVLAGLDVKPLGYGDKGNVIM